MKKSNLVLLLISILPGVYVSIHQTFISTKGDTESIHGPFGYKSRIYAGVKWSASEIAASCYLVACITAPIGIIAMPSSVLVDTLLLPYTRAGVQRNKEKLAKCIENKRKRAIDAQKHGIRWEDDDIWCKKDF